MIKQIIKEANESIAKTKQVQHAPVEWWRSSSLGSCMRGRLLARLMAGEVVPKYDDTTLGIFQMGHIVEESVMHTLRQSEDWVIFTQGEMFSQAYHLKGHFDALLINVKTLECLLVENKSRNSNAFKFATKEASVHYKMQSQSYINMINFSGFTFQCDMNATQNSVNRLKRDLHAYYGDAKVLMENLIILQEAELRAVQFAFLKGIAVFGFDVMKPFQIHVNLNKANMRINKAEVLYVSKDTYDMLEFEVLDSDTELSKAWQFEMDTLNYCWRTKQAPAENAPGAWQSKYCQFCVSGHCAKLSDKNITKAMFDIYEKRTGIIVT